jgi:hypothetical protein
MSTINNISNSSGSTGCSFPTKTAPTNLKPKTYSSKETTPENQIATAQKMLATSSNFSTTTTSTDLKLEPRNVREITKEKRLATAQKPLPITGRATLSPSKTPTRTRDKKHDCSVLDIDHILNKTAVRLLLSLLRFGFAYAFECSTKRGPTRFNGASSSCGKCEAAHAALCPSLHDNMLEIISKHLEAKAFDQLDLSKQKYLQARFKLTNEDEKKLSSLNAQERLLHLEQIFSRLTQRERQGTFVGTPTEQIQNSTFENPCASNRLDCSLEKELRALEDTLAEECTKNTKRPRDALLELQAKYCEIVTEAIINLKQDLILIDNLEKAWDQLIASQSQLEALASKPDEQSKEFENYLKSVDNYLKALDARFPKKLPRTPSLKFLKNYLSMQSEYILRQIAKKQVLERFNQTPGFLKIPENPSDSKAQFKEAKDEISRRLVEAENQLKVLDKTPDEVKAMEKYLFGEKNEAGVVVTPTKKQTEKSLLNLAKVVTPTRSDLQTISKEKSKKRLFEEIDKT